MVFKCHHCISDGIGFILFSASLFDKPDLKAFPQITIRFPLWQRVFLNLLVPLMIGLIVIKQIFIWSPENNAIKNDKIASKMSGLKNISIGKTIPIEAVKARCKQLDVTINEFVFAIISLTMKQFCVENGDTKTESIRIALPFSLRESCRHPTDFAFCNDFAIFPVDMRLVTDIKTGIKQIQRDVSGLK